MSKEKDSVLRGAMSSQEQSQRVLQDLIAAAQARSVFGEPVTHGEYAVITASEVTEGLGFGFGMGSGSSSAAVDEESEASGGGGGGGGGGGASGRPVAVISIGPHGVSVTPVMDRTNIGLAFITMLGGVFLMLRRHAAVGPPLASTRRPGNSTMRLAPVSTLALRLACPELDERSKRSPIVVRWIC